MGIAMVMGVVYAIYLLVDTQLILGRKNKNLSMDNYVLGSIIIYSDIIGLFLKILQIIGKKKDDWVSSGKKKCDLIFIQFIFIFRII